MCVCVCDSPALTVAPSVLEEPVGSASWLLRGLGAPELSLGSHVPLAHCRARRYRAVCQGQTMPFL